MKVAGGIIIPLDTTLIQNYTPKEKTGKVFSLHYSLFGSVTQFSMIITGLLLGMASAPLVGLSFGIICVFVSLSWMWMNKRDKEKQENSTIAM